MCLGLPDGLPIEHEVHQKSHLNDNGVSLPAAVFTELDRENDRRGLCWSPAASLCSRAEVGDMVAFLPTTPDAAFLGAPKGVLAAAAAGEAADALGSVGAAGGDDAAGEGRLLLSVGRVCAEAAGENCCCALRWGGGGV